LRDVAVAKHVPSKTDGLFSGGSNVRPQHSIVAMQENEIGEDLLAVGTYRLLEAVRVVVLRPPEQLQVPLPVAPVEVGNEGLAGQIVGEESVVPRLHEGEPPQPIEERLDVRHHEEVAEKRFVGDPHHGAALKGRTVGGARHVIEEMVQQPLEHAGRGLGTEGPVRLLMDRVGREGQREGMAMGKGQHPLPLRSGNGTPKKVVARLPWAQVT